MKNGERSTFDFFDVYIEGVLGIKNPVLYRVTYEYLKNWCEDIKQPMIDIQIKLDQIKESKSSNIIEDDLLYKDSPINFDMYVTYDQLFEIFPIEYLKNSHIDLIRNHRIKKILK